jgi:hypothetical protein
MWSDWSKWSECSTTCGPEGRQNRTRRLQVHSTKPAIPKQRSEVAGAPAGLQQKYEALVRIVDQHQEAHMQDICVAFTGGLLSFVLVAMVARVAVPTLFSVRSMVAHEASDNVALD